MSRIKNMTEGNPASLIVSFALPLIVANLGQQLYMIVDAIIVGKGIGVGALASVGATDWSYWMILWAVQAMTQGFAISISHRFGEGNREQLKKTVAMSVQLCLVIGIFLTVVCMLSAKPLLLLLQTPDDIFHGAFSYLLTMFAGNLVVIAYNMASSILRALGDSKTPLSAILFAAVVNIALDLLFVLVFHMGIVGAAAATVTAQFLAFLYCFHALKKLEQLKLQKEDWSADREIIRNQCRLGIPLALQNMLIAVGGMILQSVINEQGFVFIAGFTATNKIMGLLESAGISIGYAVTTYVAQNYGAGFYDRIRKGLKSAVFFSVALSACISIAMVFSGRMVLSLFIDHSDPNAAEVLDVAYQYLFIISCLLSSLYLLHVFRNTLQSLGNAFAPFLSGLVEFAARVSIACIGARFLGAWILFYSEPAAWIGAALLLAIFCIRTVKCLK